MANQRIIMEVVIGAIILSLCLAGCGSENKFGDYPDYTTYTRAVGQNPTKAEVIAVVKGACCVKGKPNRTLESAVATLLSVDDIVNDRISHEEWHASPTQDETSNWNVSFSYRSKYEHYENLDRYYVYSISWLYDPITGALKPANVEATTEEWRLR